MHFNKQTNIFLKQFFLNKFSEPNKENDIIKIINKLKN